MLAFDQLDWIPPWLTLFRARRDDAVVLGCLREFGLHLARARKLDGVHHENDPLLLFLVPYGMQTAELGAAFPLEGGPYEWARMAFGRAAGAVTAETW